MKKKIRIRMIAMLLAASVMLAGCGQKEADVNVLLMSRYGATDKAVTSLKNAFETLAGTLPFTYTLNVSQIYMKEKLIVEIAAHTNQIYIVPREDFDSFSGQGGLLPLDDIAAPQQFPDGVRENPDTHEKHVYGLPLANAKWLKDTGLKTGELYAVIPEYVKNADPAKQLLKRLL